ncbi:helix-turn-helix domain-containing protein [Streptomyces sp. NPDC090026]|uniref:helix-turn-helix domain-containing protein n=1 Tax=Streptomyces sp. NPDC090026 TaxID=3365923 RepID=UPI0037F9E76D
MPVRDDDRTAARIRQQRRLEHLTQRQLAERLRYSYSLLNQVECGARTAAPEFVDAVARALRIDVALLTGADPVTTLHPRRLAALVHPIREALDAYDLDPTPPPRPRSSPHSPWPRTPCASRYAPPASAPTPPRSPGSSPT